MFPTFIGILDIQSWWEVPSIAHFCSLFRAAFNLLDFDIEDLEEALLTDGGTEGRLLQELIVRLLEGCLPNDTRNDISTFNYQMFLRRLFRKKCQEYGRDNPFNTDVDFELLPLRQKVEILRALCDFRLDAEDVEQSLDNLDSDSLRVEPLGHDRKNSAYWYFYGTRLYREDYIVQTKPDILRKQKGKLKDKRRKRRGRNRISQTEETKEETEQDSLLYKGLENGVLPTEKETIWQVVCFTHQDWSRLVEKFKNSEDDSERKLYRTLSEDFMPEIPRLFELKEKQQRHRLLQQNSTRVLRRRETTNRVEAAMVRAKAKAKIKGVKKSNSRSLKVIEEINQVSPTPSATATPVPKKGRQTNNSLASAVGQIVIHTEDELESLTGRRGGNRSGGGITSYHPSRYEYGVEEEERRVGMHKILESLKDHQDAWPFVDPVDEEYAPRYYSVVRKPMDLTTMEEKLEGGSYRSLGQFKRDFQLIVDNCRQYNGSDNEYTEMAINLQEVFDRAVDRYLESEQSSDEDPSIQVSLSPVSMCPASPSLTTKIILPQNSRKRNRNSVKKLKLSKSDKAKKDKYTSLEEPKSVEMEENVALRSKRVKEKKNGKRAKRIKVEEVESDSENEITFSLAKRENQSDVEVCKMKTKQKKTVNFERVSSKVKKASPKEEQPDDSKRKSKKELKVQNEEIEDCEHDSQEILKSPARNRSKKSLKKELGDLLTKAKKSKKSDVKKNSVTFKANGKQETFETNEKIKKNHSKKDSSEKKVIPVVCRESTITDTERPKGKDKKLKQYREKDLKGSVLKNSAQKKDSHKLEKKEDDTKYKKLVTSNKDLESLDSLKDIISERQREDKLKAQIEGEKQKKSIKKDSLHSRKVPSNGSCLRTVSKIDAIHLRSKDGPKDEPVKKSKLAQVKRSRGFKKEDSPGIQALNQATEQTLNDINKWLDDAPRLSEFSSGSDSPVFHPATNEVVKAAMKTEMTRKRPHPAKLVGSQGPTRAKKVQRTIDRLQPGKSKGNLLKKPPHLPANISSDVPANQTTADANKAKSDGSYEPKLSLGTVLRNAESIHSICKSLVSSPNPNLIDDDDEERTTRPTSALENQGAVDQTDKLFSGKEMAESKTTPKIESLDNEGNTAVEEVQKPKSATPNLSAWFKAFGAPKSKKKEDDADENATADSNCKKETENEIQEVKTIRQRRMSTGGSSISESVSSFSQESPPGQSPQTQTPHVPNETPVRGAGFYQDALSSGSSPYNSPYYATPPRYSAQLPPTPSPQNNPSSPVYPVAAPYEQTSSLYPQTTPQTSQQVYPKHSPLQGATESYRQPSPSAFSQRSPQRIPFPQNSPQGQSFLPALPPSVQNTASPYPRSPQPSQQIYPQSSPQPPANYSQPSPQQATNYSQPSPQQPPTPNYSQPSPQQPASFSQPSPQLPTNYSQPSPQTPANYSQTSPQQPSSYSQNSPQPPQTYSQPSPQPPPNYSQTSPQQPSNYSQPSPQQPPSYSQPSPQQPSSYSQPSPQQRPSYSQTSPQQPPSYSQPSPQQPPSYSQSSPQQPPPNYSQPSPQQPVPGYSQPSPQQPSTFSQPSPQQTTASNFPQNSPQQRTGYSQPSPHQPANYSQSSPQQSASYSQPSPQQACNYSPTAPSQGSNYQQGAASSYSQSFPQSPSYSRNETQGSYLQPSPAPSLISETDQRADYQKTREVKTPAVEQQSNFTSENEGQSVNQQGFQSGEQFPPASFINSYQTPSFDRNVTLPPRVSDQQQHDRHAFPSPSDSLNIHKYAQPITQQRGFGCKTSTSGDQSQVTTDQAQLLTFQQNLATHESLYQTSAGFQAPTYPVPNPSHRPVYPSPHYFDSSGKVGNNSNSGSNIAPVKKRSYSEQPDGPRNFSQETQRIQDQFGFDAMMTLSQSDPGPGSQFDGNLNSIVDSMASNSAYARLGLGLVGRTTGKEQQLLNIPRPPSKPDPITYARTTGAASDVELNLLQSLNATKSTGIVPVSRRATDKTPTSYGPNTAPTVTTSKPKKSRKTKQQQQQQQQQQQNAALIPSSIDQQSALGISGFHQFATSQTDPIALKNPSVVTPGASAFNFAAPGTTTNAAPFYDKDATAAAFAFLDEIRNPSNYYTMALRQQQQQQQVANSSLESAPVNSNKLSNQPSHNYPPPNPFLHSQRTTAYGPPVPPYVSPHGPNLSVDPAAYQQYLRSFYALPPPPHHHRPSWL